MIARLFIFFIFSLKLSLVFGAVTVSSKNFTESFILAEISAQKLEEAGIKVDRKIGLGGTGITFEALSNANIDVYPEYTGTIIEAILKKPGLNKEQLNKELEKIGLVASLPLGFNNTYAIAIKKSFAEKHQLKKISDLISMQKELSFAFSYEFMSREDGFKQFSKTYNLDPNLNVTSMEHALTYTAIEQEKVNVIEVYSTDGKIKKLNLLVLEDDLGFFPRYEAVFLTRKEFIEKNPKAWAELLKLQGQIDEKKMIELNSAVENDKLSVSAVAHTYLENKNPNEDSVGKALLLRVWKRTKEHLLLVFISMCAATLLGIPLGILAYRNPRIGQAIVAFSSGVQTIPSLALLCFFIPLLGIGVIPALVALSLYSLLPVVLNTQVGLKNIEHSIRESAKALGLNSHQMLRLIELPLASRSILTGIKTAGIINIGTATLAALIGAGGYGASIVRGLSLNDIPTILEGAVPATILALIFQWTFTYVERSIVPKGLRLKEN